MKRRIALCFLIMLILLFTFSVTALADGSKTADKENSIGEAGQIAEEYIARLEEAIPPESEISTDEGELIETVGLDGILRRIVGEIRGESSEIVAFFLTVIGFAVLGIVSESVSYTSDGMEKTAGAGVMVLMSVALYPKMYAIFFSIRESLISVNDFFGTALPILTAITAAGGSVKTAGVQAMNMSVALGASGGIAVKILLPLSTALLALALVSSFGEGAIASVSRAIKHLFTVGLGIITAVSSAAIALQTVIASASDSAALRAARYAAGGLIPVVGSSVSSALSTLAGGLAYAKSTVGTAAIAVVLSLALAPMVMLLLYRSAFSLAILLLECVGITGGVRCFSAYRSAIDSLVAIYVMSTIMCIIQLIIFMKGGGAV